MGLMYKLRMGTEAGVMKFVLGAIVLVFVFWGVGPSGQATSSVIAEVNGEQITDTRFQKVMRNVLRSQQRSLSDDEQQQLSSRILDDLIESELMYQEAGELGLTVSDEEVARGIVESPAFQDEAGKFSQALYERILGRSGTRRSEYEDDTRQRLLIQKLVDVVAQGAAITDGQVKEAWEAQATQLEVAIARIPHSAFFDEVAPSEEALTAYATEHASEVATRYQNLFESRFHKPRRADLRQIHLRADLGGATAEALADRLAAIRAEAEAGADFAQLAKKYSESPSAADGGAEGVMSEKQLDPSVASSIFALTEPGLTDIITTDRGVFIFQVTAFLPEETTPEEDATPQLAQELMAQAQAPDLALTFAQSIATEWSAGTSPEGALADRNLSLRDVGPFSPDPDEIAGLPKIDALLEALATAPKDAILGPFGEEDHQVVLKIVSRQDADESTFDVESRQVRGQLMIAQQRELVEAWRSDLVDRADIRRYYAL